jgi:phosphatidylglycerol---prolipoprotein diacylglyceryl transferase
MITININPVMFSIGPVALRWYGLMYIVGIAVGLLVAWPYVKYKKIPAKEMTTVVVWSIIAGLVGARLYYVLQQPLGQYIHHPLDIFAVWQGGMAFYGAIFGVVIVFLVAGWRMKLSILDLMDVGGLFAVVGQFFGRIGNIINGDVIGYPTGLPWGFIYANPGSFAPRHDIAYQPAAVYEAISNILIFTALWFLRKKLKPGVLFFIYLLAYSVSQIIVFTWRDNSVVFWGLKQAQITAIAVIVAAVAVFLVIYLRRRRVSPM